MAASEVWGRSQNLRLQFSQIRNIVGERLFRWICSEAPLPTAALAMTAATPITIPNIVRTLRILLGVKARMLAAKC
jgi:hypothetical protein